MEELESIYFKDAASWRDWLEQNHDSSSGIWQICFKKHTGQPSVSYDEATEEALCFGWVDSLVRRLDADTYMRKYSPRKPRGNWSPSNKKRVERMIAAGKMHPAGLKLIEEAKANGKWDEPFKTINDYKLSKDFENDLQESGFAYRNYLGLPSTERKYFVAWVMSAKREETRQRRFREMIRKLENNEKLGMK